jgi:serine/threonine protein kinase
VLGGKYAVLERIGAGWEGEVFRVRERSTGIERAAKLFYPQRNPGNRALRFYARKLHKLRHCPILVQYHTQERIEYRGIPVTFLVSEYVEGELLTHYVARQPGKRLPAFQALHLLHALARGVEPIHQLGEYHGDLHSDNVIVERFGLGFVLKLIDMYRLDAPKAEKIRNDVCELIYILYEALGGQKHYAKQPPEIKQIIRGLKRGLILERFRTAGQLRAHLEAMQWQ